jgi:hypothetical protein
MKTPGFFGGHDFPTANHRREVDERPRWQSVWLR